VITPKAIPEHEGDPTMTTSNSSRTRKAVSRAQQIWAELDYVQRRMFELRTGIPAVSRENRLGSKQPSL
jgi:hypothetical protein